MSGILKYIIIFKNSENHNLNKLSIKWKNGDELESQIYEDNSKRIRDVCKIIKIVNNFTLNLMLRAAREPHYCSHSWNIIYYSILYKSQVYSLYKCGLHKCGSRGKTTHFRFGCKCVLCNVCMMRFVSHTSLPVK